MAIVLPGRWRASLAALAAVWTAAPGLALAARGDPPPPLLDVEPPPVAATAPAGPAAPAPVLSPALGAVTGDERPEIAARFTAAIPTGRATLLVDVSDVTGMAEVTGAVISFRPPRPLAPGPHRVRLVVDGVATTWTFTVQPGASTAPAAAAAGERREWSVNAAGVLTHQQGDGIAADTTARLLLDSRADLQGEHWYAREATDLAAHLGLQHTHGAALESRNYDGAAGVRAGDWRAGLQAGYFVPAFLDQSRLLAVGIPGGGVEAEVAAPGFSAGAYQNYDARPAGVVAGPAGPTQRLRAAGAGIDLAAHRFTLRVMTLEATDDAGPGTFGGSGEAYGVLARAAFAPAVTVLLEAAHGRYAPNAGGPDVARSGLALRLGLLGAAGGWSWTVDARRTDDGYVNPANRGFASGAPSDRTGGDATLTKQLGTVTLGGSARHLQGGTSATGSLPSAREDGGTLFATVALAPGFTITASGQATGTRSDADPARALPATDSLAAGGTVAFTEACARLQLLESYSYQSTHDAVTSTDTRAHGGQLAVNGPLAEHLLLGLTAAASQSDLPGGGGQARNLQAALRPTILLPALWLTVQPQVSWTWARAPGSTTRALDAQGTVSWSPAPLLSVQLSADWSRTDASTAPAPTDALRVMASLLVSWSAGSGRGGTAPAAPPVAPVVAVPPAALATAAAHP